MAEDVRITQERYRFLQDMETKLAEHVLISKQRLAELEAAVAKRELDKELIISEYKKERLQKLREKDRENSGAVRERVRRFNEKHRDEILEKRKLKKDAKHAEITETPTNTLSIS
jgi:hypothetical protein